MIRNLSNNATLEYPMCTTISIKDYEVDCIIGVLQHERTNMQTVLVNVDINTTWFNEGDTIETTIDYTAVASIAETLLCDKQFQLLETAACSIAETLKSEFNTNNKIISIKVKLRKEAALPKQAYSQVKVLVHCSPE
eukprot:TRINITY_DN2193_c1_g1_i3.p1 TRINITY_DN2193_c1_g1~~TRINITY_DN2193_c1_g1_i3.p1  ORF type:complete len:137 (+),score=23.87 TRINITY_DN2193_c1_g1_i3:122-532(+)